jgi:hypothetical protein
MMGMKHVHEGDKINEKAFKAHPRRRGPQCLQKLIA